jgi:hypothetical protein
MLTPLTDSGSVVSGVTGRTGDSESDGDPPLPRPLRAGDSGDEERL